VSPGWGPKRAVAPQSGPTPAEAPARTRAASGQSCAEIRPARQCPVGSAESAAGISLRDPRPQWSKAREARPGTTRRECHDDQAAGDASVRSQPPYIRRQLRHRHSRKRGKRQVPVVQRPVNSAPRKPLNRFRFVSGTIGATQGTGGFRETACATRLPARAAVHAAILLADSNAQVPRIRRPTCTYATLLGRGTRRSVHGSNFPRSRRAGWS
jgi:hypothetical protein